MSPALTFYAGVPIEINSLKLLEHRVGLVGFPIAAKHTQTIYTML